MTGTESGPSTVTVGELAAVLEAMDARYKSLFDAMSKQGESSRSEGENKEEIHPLQMPHVKLDGADSYGSWAEHAETILVSRKLEGYVLGTIHKPAEENTKEGQKWKTTNALIRAWLLSSVSPQIAKQVERIKDVSEIWRLLKGTFSGVGNEMLACKIQKELQDVRQGDKSVVDYVSELKRLWSDMDYYDPLKLECSNCVEAYNKWMEKRRVRDFLNGLNLKFENRRAAIYGSDKSPSLEQAISAIISEETRLKLEAGGATTHPIHGRSVMFAAGAGNQQRIVVPISERTCFECGLTGHMRSACPQLIGTARGRGQDWSGRGRGRGNFFRGGGRGRGGRFSGRANISMVSEDTSHIVNIQMSTEELEKWHKFRETIAREESQSAEASTASATPSGSWDWKKNWEGDNA